MSLLTREDLRRHSPFAWFCALALLGMAAWFASLDKVSAAQGTLLALLGCVALVLPPRERMGTLPLRLRRLPRALDCVPFIATLLTSPGYGVGWFYGVNPFDEAVHLLNGIGAGLVMGGLILADGVPRRAGQLAAAGLAAGLVLAVGWEAFEYVAGLIGNWQDTWTDVVLTAAGTGVGAALGAALPRTAPANTA